MPLATELTWTLSASFQASSIPLWVLTTGKGDNCVAICEYGCSEHWNQWQFREILDFGYVTNHKTLLLHHNFTIRPVHESRILSSIYYYMNSWYYLVLFGGWLFATCSYYYENHKTTQQYNITNTLTTAELAYKYTSQHVTYVWG